MAIGRFFKKIWDWIKNTAWIQPLLIVGIIFGVITSIKPIINAAQKHRQKKGSYDTFYHNYRLSLAGAANEESEADEFTEYLYNVLENNEVDAFRQKYGDKTGDKFFVAYVARECVECEDAKTAFAAFKDRLNKLNGYTAETDDPFNMVTIFADEEKYGDSEPKDTPFYSYFNNHSEFFDAACERLYDTHYFAVHQSSCEGKIEDLASVDIEKFPTPTIFLVELNDPEERYITEFMFGVEGSGKDSKAEFLFDCWNHVGEFSARDDD